MYEMNNFIMFNKDVSDHVCLFPNRNFQFGCVHMLIELGFLHFIQVCSHVTVKWSSSRSLFHLSIIRWVTFAAFDAMEGVVLQKLFVLFDEWQVVHSL